MEQTNDNTEVIQSPWQRTPAKLISYGVEHSKKKGDFDRQIGFLLLDVGVETLFKVFLGLPESVTKTKQSFGKRKKAINGSFFELTEAIKADKRTTGENIDRVRYFHGIRNKIYHQGDGVSVIEENLYEYAELASKLLLQLLDVDLADLREQNPRLPSSAFGIRLAKDLAELDDHPEKLLEELKEYDPYLEAHDALSNLKPAFDELRIDAIIAATIINPQRVRRSFTRQISEILTNYPDDEELHFEDQYENKTKRVEAFSELLGKEFHRDFAWFVQLASMDITYLYLAMVYSRSEKDWGDEIDKYESAYQLNGTSLPLTVESTSEKNRIWYREIAAEAKELAAWIESTKKMIDSIIEDSISD